MTGLTTVRPYRMRPTMIHLGPVTKIEKRAVFYPQAHLARPSGQLLCGGLSPSSRLLYRWAGGYGAPIEEGPGPVYDGFEEDGSPVAGHAFYMCDDCAAEADDQPDRDREEAAFEALHLHETEEAER